MVRFLLADRFKLKLHRETKEMNVYFLVVARKGTSLKQIGESDQGTSMHDGNGRLDATMIDMPALASYLGGELGLSVLDKTGLSGVYNIQLEWSPDGNASTPASVSSPSIFTAVQEQLGLKLEPGRGPVEMLVVDHAEKASAN
jgi:uncharacterized protein (TIGR03435 family)